jgi:hypothetical protein
LQSEQTNPAQLHHFRPRAF